MASIPGNAFIDLCAANAAETFRRRQELDAARAARRARLAAAEARHQRMTENGAYRRRLNELRKREGLPS